MTDLVQRIRERLELRASPPEWAAEPAVVDSNEVRALLREAAAALEAAREDAERLDWLDTQRGNDVQGSYPDEPQLVGHYWSIDGQCTDVRTAIDQARGKAGGEVGS